MVGLSVDTSLYSIYPIPQVLKLKLNIYLYMLEKCEECEYVEVVTHKISYRQCIICNNKQVRVNNRWEVIVGSNVI